MKNLVAERTASIPRREDISRKSYSMIMQLLPWMEGEKLQSYDWWDIWATSAGSWAKALYARNKTVGSLAVAPLIGIDLLFPSCRRIFAHPRSFPICHAHAGLGYLNLYDYSGEKSYLEKAISLVEPLLAMSSPGITGLGWGMKHDWMTVEGLIPKDTPCNTQTAYVYDFLVRLHATTGDQTYVQLLGRIAEHVAYDFQEWTDGSRLSCGYSTRDTRKVINANSYRMMMLVEAGKRFSHPEYMEKGMATLAFILSTQQPDGSWPYAEEESFVDTYHTCFVLKNLLKVRQLVPDRGDIDEAIARGVSYLTSSLVDSHGYPIPFSVKPRMVLYQYDSYDFAEAIGLLFQLGEDDRVERLLDFVQGRLLTEEGWFAFRLYPWPFPKGIPYMRYANTAMFLALSTTLIRHRSI